MSFPWIPHSRKRETAPRRRLATLQPFETLEPRLTLSAAAVVDYPQSYLDAMSPPDSLHSGHTAGGYEVASPERLAPPHEHGHVEPAATPDVVQLHQRQPTITYLVFYQISAPPATQTEVVSATQPSSVDRLPLAAKSPATDNGPGDTLPLASSSQDPRAPLSAVNSLVSWDSPLVVATSLTSSTTDNVRLATGTPAQVTYANNSSLLPSRATDEAADSTLDGTRSLDLVFAGLENRPEDDRLADLLLDDLLGPLERWQRERDSLDSALAELDEVPTDQDSADQQQADTSAKQDESHAEAHRTNEDQQSDDQRQTGRASYADASTQWGAAMVLLEATGDPNLTTRDLAMASYRVELAAGRDANGSELPVGVYQQFDAGTSETYPTVAVPTDLNADSPQQQVSESTESAQSNSEA